MKTQTGVRVRQWYPDALPTEDMPNDKTRFIPTGRPITLADELAEVDRELAMRARLYPRWVAEGKLAGHIARRRVEVLERTRKRLADAITEAAPPTLF